MSVIVVDDYCCIFVGIYIGTIHWQYIVRCVHMYIIHVHTPNISIPILHMYTCVSIVFGIGLCNYCDNMEGGRERERKTTYTYRF